MNKGKLIAFSAPSGAGKSTICNELLKRHSDIELSISATTRQPRGDEKDGEHYYFLDKKEFESSINKNEFLEWEMVHDNFYGTLKQQVLDRLEKGISILLDIDVKGALSVKRMYKDTMLFFIKAPSLEELRKRLMSRNTETEEQIETRMNRVKFEYEKAESFDFIIINDDLERALNEIESYIYQ